MTRRRFYGLLSAVLLAAGLSAATPPDAPVPHFGLARSAPAADTTLAEVLEVRLWFTEEPQAGSVSVRVVDASDQLVPAEGVRPDPEDSKAIVLPLEDALAAGRYTVSWRGMGADGHVVRDTFAFTVSGG